MTVECALQPLGLKYLDAESSTAKPIYGIYTSSWLSTKNYGKSVWGVCVNIDLDYETIKKEHDDDDQIVESCIEYLNLAPKSKYGKKRMRTPFYKFEPKPYNYKVLKSRNKTYISAVLLIGEYKNKYFWGRGVTL